MVKNYLAVDIGGSKYIIGIVNENGEILHLKTYTWLGYTQDAIDQQLKNAIQEMLNQQKEIKIVAGGVTIPGLANPNQGLWVSTEFMGIKNYSIAESLEKEFKFPFYIENDGKACVLAERHFGAGKDCDDFLYITISNGVGGGLFLNGALYRGAFGNAGEIGQIVVVENGRISDDGTKGTLEMYAATAGLVKNYIEAGGNALINGQQADGKLIAAQALAGDHAACKAFDLEGYYLGKAIALIQNVLDVKKVIIGGGLSLAFSLFETNMNKTVEAQTYKRDYPSLEIVPTPLGYEGALYGAATLAILGTENKMNKVI